MIRLPTKTQVLKAIAFVPMYLFVLVIWLFAVASITMLLQPPTQFAILVLGIWVSFPVIPVGMLLYGKWKPVLITCAVFFCAAVLITGGSLLWDAYQESQIISTPNINVEEYLPFDPDSKIATLDQEASLQLTGDLPIVDGAAAVFPLYSAFVNATYPETTQLADEHFQYTNTTSGYERLARRASHIFFGAYPSEKQIEYARNKGTFYEYTPIGMEAFVFFVHINNPVDNLTSEQIRGIYSGKITNWSQVGGWDEPITAYQRNEGSGSQSMLVRFMGDTPLMKPETETVETFMSGIIERVADYHNKPGSIGFSYRYYLESIIKNPDIKLLSVDGIAPTAENIRSGAYPITTFLYAVTYRDHFNENVDLLLEWILSPEGQELVEKTGYIPIT